MKFNFSITRHIGIVGLFFPLFCLAQNDTLNINVTTVLEIADTKSFLIRKIRHQSILAEAKWIKSKEWWAPELFIGTKVHQLDGAAMNSDGLIFTDVDRQNRWLGGDLRMSWNLGDGVFKSKAKKYLSESTRFLNQHQTNQLILEMIDQYYMLVLNQATQLFLDDLIIEKTELVNQLETQFKSGLRLESEFLLSKSSLQRLKLESLMAKQEALSWSLKLSNSLSLDEHVVLAINNELLIPIDIINDEELYSEDNETFQHPLIASAEKMKESVKSEKKSISYSVLIPEAGLSYQTGPFGENYSDTYYTNSLQAYLGWNIPLGQLIYNGDYKINKQKQKLNHIETKQQKQEISSKVKSYKTQLILLKEQMVLAQSSITLSKKALDQANLRLENNIGNSFEVIASQQEFVNSNISYIDLVCRYNNLQYQLYISLGNSF